MARRHGWLPRTPLLGPGVLLLLVWLLAGLRPVDALTGQWRRLLGRVSGGALPDPLALARGLLGDLVALVAPILLLAVLLCLAAGALQSGGRLSWGALGAPRGDRPPAPLWPSGLALCTALALGGSLTLLALPEWFAMQSQLPLTGLENLLRQLRWLVLLAALLLLTAAALDWTQRTVLFRRWLRMTPDELRRHQREQGGAPELRRARADARRVVDSGRPGRRAPLAGARPTSSADTTSGTGHHD